ncbi:unnamed protein product, partial [Heterotrigona itama]
DILYTDEFQKKVTNYCAQFGHSLWSANQLPAQEVKQIINFLLLSNNFYPVIYYTDEFQKKATNYCARFGHSLWSANQLPAQEVNCKVKSWLGHDQTMGVTLVFINHFQSLRDRAFIPTSEDDSLFSDLSKIER